mmetsp:Transcript_24294/g.54298  ORF Transcript_24294/g.54298 Transcript_24294/m.54298 type:complete len:201 (+) Transcript_24294:447-1049(+)
MSNSLVLDVLPLPAAVDESDVEAGAAKAGLDPADTAGLEIADAMGWDGSIPGGAGFDAGLSPLRLGREALASSRLTCDPSAFAAAGLANSASLGGLAAASTAVCPSAGPGRDSLASSRFTCDPSAAPAPAGLANSASLGGRAAASTAVCPSAGPAEVASPAGPPSVWCSFSAPSPSTSTIAASLTFTFVSISASISSSIA